MDSKEKKKCNEKIYNIMSWFREEDKVDKAYENLRMFVMMRTVMPNLHPHPNPINSNH